MSGKERPGKELSFSPGNGLIISTFFSIILLFPEGNAQKLADHSLAGWTRQAMKKKIQFRKK